MVDKTSSSSGGEGRPSLQQSRRRTTSNRRLQLDNSDRSGSRRSIDPPEMKHSYKPKSSRGSNNNRGRTTSPSPIDNSYRSNSTRETTITTQQSSSNTPTDTINTTNDNTTTPPTNDNISTNNITKLPQLISITIYKQSPTQPAGLKLISNNSNNSSSNNNNSSSGVIISNISSNSPFHPSNFTNSTNGLHTNDELLIVNNHRVRHPSKAVTLIKQCVSSLNVVVSRGKRIDGMTYCLVRIDNNNDIDIEDSRGNKESSVGGGSCSIATSSIKSKSKWQESKDSPSDHPSINSPSPSSNSQSSTSTRTSHGLTLYQQNNLIYISNISSSSPFHKSNINIGDILLSINGSNVQSIQDVVALLNGNSSLNLDCIGSGGDGDSNPYIKNDNKKEDRVVILLIYSIWKLRQRVLNKELQLVQEDEEKVNSSGASCKSSNSRSSKNSKVTGSKSKESSDKQVWQATYSYQEHDQSTPIQQPLVSLYGKADNNKEEYIILRIPQTTVTFKLIFNNDSECTCPNPYASLSSFPTEGDGKDKKLSKEEAHMALDLLYQKYIIPVIDALNYETGCILRLLTNLISGGSNTATTLTTTNSNKEPLHCSQEDLVNSAAKQTYEQQITLRKSFMNIQHTLPLTTSSACSTLDGNMSRRSDVSNSNKGRQQQVLDSRKWSMEPLHPYQDLNNGEPATASSSEDKSTVHSKDSKVDQLNKVDNDFQSQLNKLHISKKLRPKSSSRRGGEKTSIDSSNQFYGKDADDLELNPNRKPRNKTPPKQRTPPRPSKKKLSPPRPNRKKELTMSDAAIQPPRIQRRPSFVPVSDGKRLRSSIRLSGLSVLSSGEEEDSSSTSTTRSDEQSNSSSNDHHVNDRQQPQDRPVQATPKSKQQQEHRPSELTSSTQMVVYSPELAETSREKQAANTTKSLPKPQLKRRLKMRNGDIRKNYKVSHRIIGTGAFGVVRSCMERSTREKYAVKSILKKGNVKNATLLKNEIALVQCVHHRNVVRVIDVIQDQEYIHIIMEELKGGDLFDRVVEGNTKLDEARASEILYSLLDALAYLHERNIVHRDLKAEHIMLSKDDINSEIKIIDFGLAIIHSSDDPKMKAFAGSAFTVAPEVIKRSYDKQCDLWSVGVITYFLLTARMPFNAKSDKEIFKKIIAGDYSYPAWTEKGLSDMAKDFIDSLLVVDPRKRLTAKQALSHVFIRKYNRTQDVNTTRQISQELALVPVQSDSVTPSRTPPPRRRPDDERRRDPRHPQQRAVKKYNSERNMTVSSRRRGEERSPKPTQRRGYTPRGTL